MTFWKMRIGKQYCNGCPQKPKPQRTTLYALNVKKIQACGSLMSSRKLGGWEELLQIQSYGAEEYVSLITEMLMLVPSDVLQIAGAGKTVLT
jgi:hypothetical protein